MSQIQFKVGFRLLPAIKMDLLCCQTSAGTGLSSYKNWFRIVSKMQNFGSNFRPPDLGSFFYFSLILATS